MKLFVALFVVLSMLLLLPANGAEEQSPEQAVAVAYFEALVTGDVDKANSLITVPYSLDRKAVLKTADEVVALHKKILADKGKRPLPEYSVAKTDAAPELDAKVFPKHVVYRMTINQTDVDKKHEIDIYVTVSAEPEIIGFSD